MILELLFFCKMSYQILTTATNLLPSSSASLQLRLLAIKLSHYTNCNYTVHYLMLVFTENTLITVVERKRAVYLIKKLHVSRFS